MNPSACTQNNRSAFRLFYDHADLTVMTKRPHNHRIVRARHQPLLDCAASGGLLATDQNNSALSTLRSNGWGNNVYAPYGHTADAFEGPSVLFNGERLDLPLCGYLLGNGRRLYRPLLMRFCAPDALNPFAAGGLNAYVYCHADPVNRTDPSGQFSFWSSSRKAFSGQGREIASGKYAFMAKHPRSKGKAITVLAHGSSSPGQGLGAQNVIDLLENKGFNTAKYDTHFIVCHSANPYLENGDSFIDAVAKLTGRSATGYKGTVSVHHDIAKSRGKMFTKGRNLGVHVVVYKTAPSSALKLDFSYQPVVAYGIRQR